jgi:PAS domain S-box-containing protein
MSPSFVTIPRDPLARFRLLALWFGVFVTVANGLVVPFLNPTPQGFLAAGASLLLASWWAWGFKRGGFPDWGWPVDFALLIAATSAVPLPMRGLGLYYAGVQFRGLYVPQRRLLILLATYDVARLATALIAPFDDTGTFLTPLILQIIALTVVGATMYAFVAAMVRQKETEYALQHSDERYRLLAAATRDVFYDWDVRTGQVEWSDSLRSVLGYNASDANATHDFLGSVMHPDDTAAFNATVQAFLADPDRAVNTAQYRLRRRDGTYAFVQGNALMQRGDDGRPARVMGAIRDITIERELAEQLQQSQKMEAVGQLAGGIAHDFNNLLTVIGGHVYMLDQKLGRSEATERHLGGITKTTERAAQLTKQLLAFSRKQILQPTVINLNVVVDDVVEMIRPAIGEQVQVVTSLDPLLSPVIADAGQISQVLVNLAINARDAMPQGGTLSIRTSNTTIAADADSAVIGLPPADYVKIVVRDTGVGMDAATLERAFEPFFTTKPPGSGTGLGLATVYGIVKQSLGDIRASSAPGEGSAFTILLPAAKRPADVPAAVYTSGEHSRVEGERNVLLVEDDDGVRDFAREVLLQAGYRVREARNGLDGLDVAGAGGPIDLVVTDIVMPRMGGRAMVDILRRDRPDLRVLYMTGYTDDAQMIGELRATDARLLEKPFTARGLARAVGDVSVVEKA